MLYVRPTHLQTTDARSNAYWLQYSALQNEVCCSTFPNSHQEGCSKKSAFKMDSDIQSLQMKTERIIQ